jgi:ribulose-phosphate 3-epimerase
MTTLNGINMQRQSLSILPHDQVLIFPSILAADFSRLGEEIRAAAAAGADGFHVDVMDGHFVPNISFGLPVLEAIRPCSSLAYDVHLMITDPDQFVEAFAKAGADNITFHIELAKDIRGILRQIHALGMTAGLSLRPGTPAETVLPYLDEVDLILVMTVEPGFGGQSFRAEMMPKLAQLRQAIDASGRPIHLEVDGGITAATAPLAIGHGARMLVAGTSVFRAKEGMAAAIRTLRGQ